MYTSIYKSIWTQGHNAYVSMLTSHSKTMDISMELLTLSPSIGGCPHTFGHIVSCIILMTKGSEEPFLLTFLVFGFSTNY